MTCLHSYSLTCTSNMTHLRPSVTGPLGSLKMLLDYLTGLSEICFLCLLPICCVVFVCVCEADARLGNIRRSACVGVTLTLAPLCAHLFQH